MRLMDNSMEDTELGVCVCVSGEWELDVCGCVGVGTDEQVDGYM